MTQLVVPLPVARWNGVLLAEVDHNPRPFYPPCGSSMRASIHLAKRLIG